MNEMNTSAFQNIGENRLGRDGADAICDTLCKNETLKSLNMSGMCFYVSCINFIYVVYFVLVILFHVLYRNCISYSMLIIYNVNH